MSERRYSVVHVCRDGAEIALSHWSDLDDALSERDLQRRDHAPLLTRFEVVERFSDERHYLQHSDARKAAA